MKPQILTLEVPQAPQEVPHRKAYPVVEAAVLLGISPRKLYQLLKGHHLIGRKIGGRTVIEDGELDRYLAEAPEAFLRAG